LNFGKNWPYHEREMEKIDFEIFKKIWPYHQREMKILNMP
jgi:hypothetical protein